jgi:hypothetical protein
MLPSAQVCDTKFTQRMWMGGRAQHDERAPSMQAEPE